MEADQYWSGARWAPSNFQDWPVAAWAQPQDREEGFAWKLSEFGPTGEGDMAKIHTYHGYALTEYRRRWPEIREWIEQLSGTVVLACWCPFSSISRKQLQRYGTFHCHLGVVQVVLESAGVAVTFGPEHTDRMIRG